MSHTAWPYPFGVTCEILYPKIIDDIFKHLHGSIEGKMVRNPYHEFTMKENKCEFKMHLAPYFEKHFEIILPHSDPFESALLVKHM